MIRKELTDAEGCGWDDAALPFSVGEPLARRLSSRLRPSTGSWVAASDKELQVETSTVSGLAETSALRLFMSFPVPLALLRADGRVEITNGRFDELADGRCLESGVLRDIAAHPGRTWRPMELPQRHGESVPARAQAMRISNRTLIMIDTAPGGIDAEQINHLQRRILELETSSSCDHLTGAWNRAHLDRTIEHELSRSLRYKQSLSLILMDIDHFKLVNDGYGHLIGDAVLRELVRVVGANIRAADLLFRWGGEEFVVLVPAGGYRAAERLGENLRHKIEKHAFPSVGSVTVSVGVAEHSGAESAAAWFQRLDEALYSAKREGRNRLVVDRRGNSDEWAADSRKSTLRLVWQEGYECGQPLIDSQHRRLFDLANALIVAASGQAPAPAACEAALDLLLRHIAGHFADEEALLAEHHYLHLKGHRRAHAKLLADAAELRARASTNSVHLGELVEFLANDVVSKHLLTADRDFFPLFGSSGVRADTAMPPLPGSPAKHG